MPKRERKAKLRESRPLVGELTAKEKAGRTARWARIMTKWLITRVRAKRGWEIVNFTGRAGAESRGVVDLLAIRKDHVAIGFPRGDLFEMILIQVKGGNARWPSDADIVRLRAVAKRYNYSMSCSLSTRAEAARGSID